MNLNQEQRRSRIKFNQPFAEAVDKLRRDALSRDDYDPAQLFAWGQMMAVSLLEMLKAVETRFGREGQQICTEALVERRPSTRAGGVGRRRHARRPVSPIEAISLFATWINEQLYASIEKPSVDGPNAASFDILWCPHQDVYGPFDCRVQRYLVEGLMRGAREKLGAAFDGVRRRLRQHDPGGRPDLPLPHLADKRGRRGCLDRLLAAVGG